MEIYKNLVEKTLPIARAKYVKKVVVGINYTFVEIKNIGGGLAYTFLEKNLCCEIPENIHFWNKPADILIKNYLYGNFIEKAVALATINALVNRENLLKNQQVIEDIFSYLHFSTDQEVVMIGNIKSIADKLKGKVKKLWIFDGDWNEVKPSFISAVKNVYAVFITASTLVNQTLEEVLEHLKDVPEVILIGPSTPLIPEIFRFTPITYLCGSICTDHELLFRLVCEAKGTPAFFKTNTLKKITIKVKK